MKHFMIMVLVLLAVCAGACTSQKNAGTGFDEWGEAVAMGEVTAVGETIGEAAGFRGIIRVRVTMEQGTITDIAIMESREDRAVGGAAIEELIDLVLLYNTTELDLIAGASVSSKGFLAAIEHAILDP